MPARRGFAMITVLWVMAVAGILTATAVLAGRTTIYATRNRVELERARWIATGCLALVQSAIDARLADARSFEDAADIWRSLDRAPSVGAPGCAIRVEAAGTRLDVNEASADALERLFLSMGRQEDAANLAGAIVDWRDSDDVALPLGAERDWYASAGREMPRNGPFADGRELARLRGFENVAMFDSVLWTEPGRVSLATAPVAVLRAVPGFTRETAERMVELRDAGTPPADVLSILGSVSRASAESLVAHYPEITRMTTANPEAWILTVRAESGWPRNAVVLSERLVRAGKRAIIVHSRSSL